MEEKIWKCVFSEEDHYLYPFTLPSGGQILLIHGSNEKSPSHRGKEYGPTRYCLDTEMKKYLLPRPKLGYPLQFLAESYFTSDTSNLIKKPSDTQYHTTELFQLKNEVAFITLKKIQDFRILPNSLTFIPSGIKGLEILLISTKTNLILYSKPSYSPLFSEVSEVYTYSPPHEISYGPTIRVHSCPINTRKERKDLMSKFPIKTLPVDLLVEVLEFLLL